MLLLYVRLIMNISSLAETQPRPFKGLLIRILAAIIDSVVISIGLVATVAVVGVFFGSLFGEGAGIGAALIFLILISVLLLLYKPLMEASEYQGTIGKIALNMKVVDKNGQRITMTKSFVRTVVYILQTAIPGINAISWMAFFMIAFTEENQSLHDVAAETYVVSKYWQGQVPLQDKFGA